MTPGARRLLWTYAALSLIHLVLLYAGPDWAITLTKALLVPLLAAAAIVALRPRRDAPVVLLVAALAASWLGDVLLTFDGWFVPGLLAFLAAHVAYVVLFLRLGAAASGDGGQPSRRRPPLWTLVYVAWYASFLALLAPHLGALLVPVAAYGAVLGAMAALAAARGRLVAVGGALFVVSDSVLALGRFLPGYEFALHDLVVMSTYLGAQALITIGVVTVLAVAVPSSPGPDRRASATAR
ncbi:lysoplasmalogenase [Agromyces sp. MMS24-K17]|uniref:lysoplasmalogenase n=1 Tax=Agromyces sp. MMS24-K17 TaxID=3372850 RepID=UPI00375487CD